MSDGEIALEEIETQAELTRERVVVVALLAEEGVHTGVGAEIEIEQRGRVRRGEETSVFERHAKIEDVGMRVEGIARGVDGLSAHRRGEYAGLHVDPALGRHRQMDEAVGFDDVELIAAVDRAV